MLNWIVRYAVVAELLDREDWSQGTILDVGSGPHGISCVRPALPFVGLDVAFPERAVPSMTAIQAPPGPLPFADAAFDTVISLDTLEHMRRDARPAFLAELGRVAARRVVMACPERRAAPADDLVAEMILEHGQPKPPWLAEHEEFGLPGDEETGKMCRAVPGFTARPLATVNALLSILAVIGDIHPRLAAAAQAEVAERTADWERLFLAGCFGPAARTAWILEREAPATSVVANDGLPAAVRCPACGEPLRVVDATRWACPDGHPVVRDPATDAWVLGTVPPAAPVPAPPPPAPDPRDARIAELERRLAHAENLRIVRWTAPVRRAVFGLRRGRSG